MYRFYPLLLLVCVLLVVGLGRDLGPMITVEKSYRSLNKTLQARNPAVTVELEGITANAPGHVNALAGMLEGLSIPGSGRGSVSSLDEVQGTSSVGTLTPAPEETQATTSEQTPATTLEETTASAPSKIPAVQGQV